MSAFSTTHWSVILEAGKEDTAKGRAALDHVCERYWRPLYAHIRRLGYDPDAAKDATQSFFQRLIEDNLPARAKPSHGRFRTFLLATLERHLTSQRRYRDAQKRGGRSSFVHLESESMDAELGVEARDNRAPDKLFERDWAINLLNQAINILEEEYRSMDKGSLFEALHSTLIKDPVSPRYRKIAEELKTSEGAVKVAVHRMRQRFREIFTGLVASTISDPAEVQAELKYLQKVLSGD